VLRRTLEELRAIVDARVSEVEGGRRRPGCGRWYAQRHARAAARHVAADERAVCGRRRKVKGPGPVRRGRGHARRGRGRGAVPPRHGVAAARLLQRFSVNPEGIRFLVDMRAEMQPHLKADKRLLALDVEMEYMFSTWFDVGFLELRRISWDSPASLMEKLIKYEAVHDIRSWADVKNRLDSDRRCYGFFHPRLPDEPLIFVEVALMDDMADSITPLLDEAAAAVDLKRATTAIFYSISNTQTGLRGVSFGDSLIKRVVETLKAGVPPPEDLRHPVAHPWLPCLAPAMRQSSCQRFLTSSAELGRAVGFEPPAAEHLLSAADKCLTMTRSRRCARC
jgi:malonyl-CoA decarboxylase